MKKYKLTVAVMMGMCGQVTQAEDDTFVTQHFSGSGNCTQCHDSLNDISGNNVSIVRDWGASMMANSSKDPFWQAKVASELHRNAHLAQIINDKCSACHAPMANYEITKVEGNSVDIFGANGLLGENHAMNDAAMNGVSCTLCHQVADAANLGTLEGFSGHYEINGSKTIYGQFDDIFGNPMINNTGYRPAYSAHISSSEMCATCHELSTPYVDADGNVLSTTPDTEFPEQTPFTEWKNSDYSDTGSDPKSCSDCHMPQTTAKVSNRPSWLGSKEGFAKHHFVGANATMLAILRDNASELGVTSTQLDLGIDRTRILLQESVDLEIVSTNYTDGILEVKVRLSNNSGHKTPTSFPSRRMWLHFRVSDQNNRTVFESGSVNADGSITGAENDLDQTRIEPHYDLITASDQVQIYEAMMGDSDAQVTYTLLRGARYLKDNRLTPQGFDKAAVPDKVAVQGAAVNDGNFNQGADEVTYRFPLSVSGDLTVEVNLNYQTIMHGFIQDLYQDADLPQVQAFRSMYQAQTPKYEQITSTRTTVSTPIPTPTRR